jgi:hypothetical protein
MNMNNNDQQLSTPMQRFFWWFAGADIHLLEMCRSDWHRFTAIGIFVVIVGALATISGTFFLTQALSVPTYLALFGGLFWGGVIVSVDRVLLTHFEKGKRQLMRALPRIGLAVVISLVINHPLLLKMFEGEIEARLFEVKKNKLDTARTSSTKQTARASLNEQITKVQERLTRLQEIKDEAEADMNKERGGVKTDKTTGTIGEGGVFGLKKKIFDDASANLEKERPALDAQLSDLRSKLADIEKEIALEVGEVNDKESKAGGVLNRQKALSSILREDSSLAFEAMCLFLVLLGVETLPLTQKLLSPMRRYDRLVQDEAEMAETDIAKGHRERSEYEKRERNAEKNVLDRVYTGAADGDLADLQNEAERELANAIHLEIVRRGQSRLRPQGSTDDHSLGRPVTIEVHDHPQLTGQLSVPRDLERSVTLSALSHQIDAVAGEVATDLGYPVRPESVSNSSGGTIDQVSLPLIQQLNEDRTMVIKFVAI